MKKADEWEHPWAAGPAECRFPEDDMIREAGEPGHKFRIFERRNNREPVWVREGEHPQLRYLQRDAAAIARAEVASQRKERRAKSSRCIEQE